MRKVHKQGGKIVGARERGFLWMPRAVHLLQANIGRSDAEQVVVVPRATRWEVVQTRASHDRNCNS